MNNKRRINIFLAKLYVLCLIIVLVGCIPATTPPPTPIETTQSNESKNKFFLDRQMIVTGPRENVDAVLNEVGHDAVLIEEYDLSFFNTFSFDSVNELQNEQNVFDDPKYLTGPLQNSAPSSLPNGGGGGGGGRRRIQQGML